MPRSIARAASFDNPDHVAIVIHNYRWRLGLAEGEAKYDDSRSDSPQAPVITVPTITLEGDANGAPHPEPAPTRGKFTGRYEHRIITRRHRTQPAAGGAAGLRPGHHRRLQNLKRTSISTPCARSTHRGRAACRSETAPGPKVIIASAIAAQ